MAKGSGINGRSDSVGMGQCINSSLPHDWYMTGQPGGRLRTDRRSRLPTCPLSIPSDSPSASTRTQLFVSTSSLRPGRVGVHPGKQCGGERVRKNLQLRNPARPQPFFNSHSRCCQPPTLSLPLSVDSGRRAVAERDPSPLHRYRPVSQTFSVRTGSQSAPEPSGRPFSLPSSPHLQRGRGDRGVYAERSWHNLFPSSGPTFH
jgi:hypothetical protein